ncbi:uncharacterized protein VDAG_00702 [Verticillium dahliae VdLs.17]|uniref:Uncharacterized protein n=1 Tax=Verticillium dahliae (strain VdLs.17 / ATCC MYA-4575 / FGSC 10137) TaxID=498257 RepID=G2WQR0_VERDV|nr:uncharacterized protein VDAG_00702 [Verticillium dahliae VdLs.17]EGY14020.1 hypothetical protein VDAG_00702 [Verticillium dahliae VdLs.17]
MNGGQQRTVPDRKCDEGGVQGLGWTELGKGRKSMM